jgi:hypothetical protein
MHAWAHEVNGPRFVQAILTAKGVAGIAAVLSQLRDSRPRPLVLTLWRFDMEKNAEHKKEKDEETLSDEEVWWTIRYLDPDVKDKADDGGVIITLLALFAIICVVVAVLYSRGL